MSPAQKIVKMFPGVQFSGMSDSHRSFAFRQKSDTPDLEVLREQYGGTTVTVALADTSSMFWGVQESRLLIPVFGEVAWLLTPEEFQMLGMAELRSWVKDKKPLADGTEMKNVLTGSNYHRVGQFKNCVIGVRFFLVGTDGMQESYVGKDATGAAVRYRFELSNDTMQDSVRKSTRSKALAKEMLHEPMVFSLPPESKQKLRIRQK